MSIRSKIAEYKRYSRGVCHCTFNPGGPGVVRIHLVPPKFSLIGGGVHVVILNGYYVLPIGSSWAAILSEFIDRVNEFDSREIGEDDEKRIVDGTVESIAKLYSGVDKADIDEVAGVVAGLVHADTSCSSRYWRRRMLSQYSSSLVRFMLA